VTPKRARAAALAAVLFTATLGGVMVLTRPPAPRAAPERAREEAPATRAPGEPPPAVDDDHAFAPGSPGAVAERFLRAFWRAHYVDAAALATGETLARCRRDQRAGAELPPEHAELFRRVRVFREASRYRLERVTVTELPPGADGAARRLVQGEAHATGPSPDDARMVESRRGQRLELVLVDGAWKVSAWTATARGPAPDAGASR
jgi:hypothetical protein